ncbi:winged helix-turn-helix domain-containing protein [Serratia fonticola]|uniref:winged helix-turn-helix domain-containing protein n=1 Tax=Serratia fonticola TaxID=47917 RepID=UPI0015C68140|nr:winged helix-turn-helix domain-containing protein [Serratia fonticola]MBC3378953.1 winged helix-turn-helix domain-containing protein [Serratia fonticola]NYA38153.1 winged helix-turn-helix domain-containing protein [Serratia fonticola]
MQLYIINSDVTFDPESNVIHSKINNKTVNMLTPSGQCLLILLENKGNIVSKKEIYEFVWERYGLTATDNAFYQTVLYLRKNLKEAGLLTEVVKTVPRKGVLVPSTVKVEKIVQPQEASIDIPATPVDKPLLQRHDDEPADLSQIHPVVDREATTAEDIDKTPSDTDINSIKKSTHYSFYFLPLLIALMLVLAKFWQVPEETADYFANYTKVTELEGCSIFTDAGQKLSAEYEIYIVNTPINCNRKPYIYFIKMEFVKRISLINCAKEENKGTKRNECVSYYKVIK